MTRRSSCSMYREAMTDHIIIEESWLGGQQDSWDSCLSSVAALVRDERVSYPLPNPPQRFGPMDGFTELLALSIGTR